MSNIYKQSSAANKSIHDTVMQYVSKIVNLDRQLNDVGEILYDVAINENPNDAFWEF